MTSSEANKPRVGTIAQTQKIVSGFGGVVGAPRKNTPQAPIRREEAERNKNHNIMENHLYECLYDILRGEAPETDKYYTLQIYKAKIVNLHSRKRAKILLDTNAHNKMEDEGPTLYHVVQQRRRRELREIREIQDTD
jgi:hypothetical protein